MKKILFFLTTVFLFISFIESKAQPVNDWKWAYPKPLGITLQWCQMFDANTMYAGGYYGGFAKTTDGGATWFYNASNVNSFTGQEIYVYGGFFLNMNTGFVCGSSGSIQKTTDAGVTWDSVGPGPTSTNYALYFINNNTGFCSGSTTRDISKTTDGGATWTDISGNIAGSSKYCVYAWDANNIIVGTSSGDTYKTTNGGTNWTLYDIGYSATIRAIKFIDANTGFCSGSSGTVRKTVNGGVNWTDASGNIAGSTKYSLYAIDQDIIMVGETGGDIWRTTNGGTTWTEHAMSGGTMYNINFLNSNTGFACGSSTTVKKTTNAGANWTTFSTSGVPSSTFYDVDFYPMSTSTILNQTFASTTFPPTGWTETGTTSIWSRQTVSAYGVGTGSARAYFYGVSSGTGVLTTNTFTATTGEALSFDHAYANYSSPADDSLHIQSSTNGGSTWTTVLLVRCQPFLQTAPNTSGSFVPTASQWASKSFPLPTGTNKLRFNGITDYGNNLFLDNINVGSSPNVFITGNPFAVYKSPIGAPSWDTLGFLSSTQPVTSTYYSTSLATGDAFLTVGAYGLINKRNSASNRQTFRPDWTWMTSTTNAVGVIGNTVIIPTSYSTVWISTNNGTSWDTTRTNTAYSGTLYSVSTVGNNAWVSGSSGKVNKSTNAGATWSEINDIGTYTLYNVNFVDANTGWVFGSSGRCYKTTNGGTNFALQITPGVTSSIYGSSFVNATTGWFVGSSGRVSKTTNGGTNWVAQTSQFTSTLRNIDMVNANTGWMVGYSRCVRKTTNGGTNWDTVAVPFTNASHYGVDFVDEWNGMVTASYGITYRTRDGGTTWIFERTGGISQYGVKMQSSDSGWACSSSGYIFKYKETLTGHNTYTHEVPVTYELLQNYPNPFNPTTTIQFALPKAGMVSLKIYDVSGRLIRNLVNNEGLNEGTFKYIFDGKGIASGVYFYSLIVNDDLIGTKKMVLIK